MQLRALPVLLVTLGLATPVRAGVYDVPQPRMVAAQPQDTRSEAEKAFEEGSEAYALGNYEEAVGAFERSYELSNKTDLLFNLGQAYAKWYDVSRDIGHLRKARKLFENYIIFLDSQAEPDAEARADAEERIEELDERIEAHEGASSTGAPDRDRNRRTGAIVGGVVGGLVVVAGAVILGVLLSRPKSDEPELGTIGAVRGPGFRF